MRRLRLRLRLLSVALIVLCLVVLESLAWISPVRSTRRHSSLNDLPRRTAFLGADTIENHVNGGGTNRISDERPPLPEKFDLKLILIDHYDSFTYNLFDILAQLCTTAPLVLAADCADSWEDLLQQSQTYRNWTDIDGVILSPGPGNPQTEGKLSRDVIRKNPDLPILGVCLGHQIIGDFYGAKVGLAPEPVHGQVRSVRLLEQGSNDPVWKNVTEAIKVTRYHSLHVTDLTKDLIPTAETEDEGILMAMRHRTKPHFGLQFHPESIGTPRGKQLLSNFCKVVQSQKAKINNSKAGAINEKQNEPERPRTKNPSRKKVFVHKVASSATTIRPENVMKEFLSDSDFTFWLDGDVPERKTNAPSVSILGSSSHRLEYWGEEKPKQKRGMYRWKDGDDLPCEVLPDMDVLTYLQEQYDAPTVEVTMVSFADSGSFQFEEKSEDDLQRMLPFDFRGGHVGFLGYEVRHDTARFLEQQERGRHQLTIDPDKCRSDPRVPTAAFLVADKSYVFDQQTGDWYLVAVASLEIPGSEDEMLAWIKDSSKAIESWQGRNTNGIHHERAISIVEKNGVVTKPLPPKFRSSQSRETYNDSFDQCIEHIRQGNSYELCLTNQFEALARVPGSSPADLYHVLRQRNPAPHSAFINWNSQQRLPTPTGAAFAICCSSPERFVSVSRRKTKKNAMHSSKQDLQVEAKPIKGTVGRVQPQNGQHRSSIERRQDEARAQELQSSEKDRAENLMIVDLLRNDLSRVCTTGTVHVAKLMDIESFATVHQMVSTIRGRLDPSQASALDVLRACFPGGSMTGAPKLRTMEILDEIEENVCRGPYSGSLGYMSWNGCMDMNIVIRTAVVTPQDDKEEWKVSIGAGGAITALSQKRDEYEEMVLKSSAVVQAVQEWATGSAPAPVEPKKRNKVTNEQVSSGKI